MPWQPSWFQLADAMEQLTTTVAQRTYLSEATQAQPSSMTWYTQRAGHINATKVYDILHTKILLPHHWSVASDVISHLLAAVMPWPGAASMTLMAHVW